MANYTVTTLDDTVDAFDGELSLREALALADLSIGADVITFDASLAGQTLTLTNQLTIASDVTIDGDATGNDDGADITIDGDGTFRVFDVTAGTSTLDALTITGGYVLFDEGGGIRIASAAALTISNSTIAGNEAYGNGGGIWNAGSVTLTGTTIADNSATSGYHGGGLFNAGGAVATLTNVTLHGNDARHGGGIYNDGTATLVNSTVTGNAFTGKGGGTGGIYGYYGTTTLTNSIVAGNAGSDLYGFATFLGRNIVGVGTDDDGSDGVIETASLADLFDALVTLPVGKGSFQAGALADNGGPVATVALVQFGGNPAVDAGDDTLAAPADARGAPRADVPGVAHNGANISDIGAFEAAAPAALDAESLVVTTADDVVDWGDGLTSLREALTLANSTANGGDALNDGLPDVITFAAALAGQTLTLTRGQLTIASDLTIVGDAAGGDGIADITIDAGGYSRVFDVTAGDSTLHALTITGGNAVFGDGGGVRIAGGADLTITNSTISGNVAGVGGGIHNYGTVTLTDSTIAANEAYGKGFGRGGGLYNNGTASLTNVTVHGNGADYGGGIYNFGTADLTNVTVTANQGGAAGIYGYFGTTTLTNSIVAGNYGSGKSGLVARDLEVNGATYLGLNIVGVGSDDDGTDGVVNAPSLADLFATANPGGMGGGLADNGGPVATVALAQLPGNPAIDGGDDALDAPADARGQPRADVPGVAHNGANISDIGAFEAPAGTLEAPSLVVTTAADVVDWTDGLTSLREALTLANSLAGGGDALGDGLPDVITFAAALAGQTLTLTQGQLTISSDVTIDGDAAGNDDVPDITIDAGGLTRVLDIRDGVSTLNALIIQNGAAAYGGGVNIGAYLFGTYAEVTIANSVIRNNIAAGYLGYGYGFPFGYGGGIALDSYSALRLINSTVSGNAADIGGGIAVNYGATLTVVGSTVSDNRVDNGYLGFGGGIANQGYATLVSTTVSGNTALAGGGIYNQGELTLVNTTLAGNVAAYGGGGLYNTACGCAAAALYNSTIAGNFSGIGGGIAHYAGALYITNSIVAGNGAGIADADLAALGSVTFYGANILSQGIVGTPGGYTLEADLANIFQTGVLADNGGPVATIAIRIGGVAHDTGDAGALPADTEDLDGDSDLLENLPFDARGLPRVFAGGLDIGAFEQQVDTVNDAPVNSVPDAQALEANHSLALTGLSIADPDALDGPMSTTLSVAHGTLALAALGGAVVSGSGSGTVQVTGTLAAINATLAGGNLVYTPETDWFDDDTLTMATDDGGNSGTGGPLTDTDTVAIDLRTKLSGTPDDDSFVLALLPAGDIRIDAVGGLGDTLTLDFRLVDATVRYVGNTIVIDGPSRHLVVTGFERYVFTDGTVDNHDGSPLVDDLFYNSRNHDVWNAQVDADAHFSTLGWHENRDPNAFFSLSTYLSAYPDVAATGINPLAHFHSVGWQEGRIPSVAFDPRQYLAANPDVAAAHVDPLEHYLAFGHQEGRTPFAPAELIASNGFDYVWYLAHNPDVAAAKIDAFVHFMTVGWTEGRNPNALFDVNGYLMIYADVGGAGVNPLTHYNQFGWLEGRDPSVGFDTTAYLAAYPDVAAANVNPLTHFLQFGNREGRLPFADGVWG